MQKKLFSQEYDLCVVLESNFEYTNFAHKVSSAALRIGIESEFSNNFFHKAVKFSRNRHAIENYLHVVSDLLNISICEEDYAMDIFLSPSNKDSNRIIAGKKFFVVHTSCSSYLPYKGWETGKWIKVCEYLISKNFDVVITGAHADKEPKDLLEKLSQVQNVYGFIGKKLEEVILLLKQAEAIVCLDTGILHIGRALSKPMVCLFGPSDPAHTGPIGPGVYKIIRKEFPCGPCQYSPDYNIKEKEKCLDGNLTPCMEAIEIAEVTGAIEKIL